jgi:hypothetical protein
MSVGLVDASVLFEGMHGHPALTSLDMSNNQCGQASWSKLDAAMSAGLKLSVLRVCVCVCVYIFNFHVYVYVYL